MRKLIVFLASASFFLGGCTSPKKIAASPVGVVNLANYFTRNTEPLPDSVNFRVVTKQADFDKIFGSAQTAGTEIKRPDFSGQLVVAVISKPTNRPTEIKITKAEMGGSDLNVYYSMHVGSVAQTFNTTPSAIVTVPKSQSVKRVNFFLEGGGGVKNGMVEVSIK